MDSAENRTPETQIEAARHALFQLDMHAAIRLAQDILAGDTLDPTQRDTLYEIYTDALIGAGQLDLAEATAKTWIDTAPTPLNRANAHVKYANIQHRMGFTAEALKTLEDAQEYARLSGNRSAMAKVLRLRADILWAQGSIEKALFLLQQALAIQEVLGDTEQQVGIYVSMSIVYDLLARPYDAVQASLRAAKLCEERGDTFSLMIIFNNLAEQYLHLFALDRALEAIRKSRALLGEVVNGDLDRNEGLALLALGRREEGLVLLRRGVEVGDTSDHDELLQAMYSLGEGLLQLDHVSEAEQISQRLVADARHLSATRHIARGSLLLGQVAARRGDYEGAEDAFQEAFVNGQKSGDKWLIWQAHAAMATTFFEVQPALAEFHRGTVIELLTRIAESIHEPELRENFKNATPVVRWLRDAALLL
jgi:tetratricopeptide (TPR) repeat protein